MLSGLLWLPWDSNFRPIWIPTSTRHRSWTMNAGRERCFWIRAEHQTLLPRWASRLGTSQKLERTPRAPQGVLEFHMSPQSWHHHRPPVAVVTGIDDVLHSGSEIDSAPNVCRVIRFDDVLPAVVQLSVAQQEAVPTDCQIDLVILLDAIRPEGNAGTDLLALPLRAIHPHTLV